MSDTVKITKSKIDALAAAFRSKIGTEEPITLQDMIMNIEEIAKPKITFPDPGTYDANGNPLKSWAQLVSDGDVTVTNGTMTTHYDRETRFANVDKVAIDPSVTSIGSYAFAWCTNLATINIPDGVTSIGEGAFNRCNSLTTITIPDGVTSIGILTFSDCTSLTTITIPDGVTSIDFDAFAGCTSLTEITIPDSVTSIGDSVFASCTSLTEITIPDSVTSIGDSVFANCDNLTTIHYSGTADGEPWGALNAKVVA